MDGLSPETRALLDCARDGDRLDGDRREALRQGLATALGVAVAGIPRAATSVRWTLRTFGAVGATGAAVVLALGLRGVLVHEAPASPSIGARVAAEAAPSPAPRAPSAFDAPATSPVLPVDARENPPPTETHRVFGPRLERPPAPGGDALGAEARLLASAQSAVDLRHGARALALLDEHDRRFPGGVLTPESEALRVDALCAAGRADDANAEALRVRTLHPASPVRPLPASCVNGAR